MHCARGKSILQLHLPEDWPDETSAVFRYALFAGGSWVTGAAPLSAVPPATTTIAVAPASTVHFVRVPLPNLPPARMARLLPLAVEDAIAVDPEDVHVVLLEHSPDGASLVAVVNKAWLAAVLRELGAHRIRPSRFIVETELAARLAATEATHPWLVVLSPDGGFAFLGARETIALDLGEDSGSLPLALRLARSTHRRSGETPAEILVFGAPETCIPDFEAWGRMLEIPVRDGGEWRPELIDARTLRETDLLRGGFGPSLRSSDFLRTVKFAGVTAAAVLAVHTVLTVGDWWWVSSETQQLKTQMEHQFREIFPDTQAVVNAPLQMQRSLGRLRREAGVPDASDFIPLLAAVAPSLSAAGLHTERMRYERGTLEVDVSMPAEAGRETLEKQLHVPGYRVRVDRMSTGPSGSVATVLVSAEA